MAEIKTYSTYSNNEENSFNRADGIYAYASIDKNSAVRNENVKIDTDNTFVTDTFENDTTIAPTFKLSKGTQTELSGIVYEDSPLNDKKVEIDNNKIYERVGDGVYNNENVMANVLVEILSVPKNEEGKYDSNTARTGENRQQAYDVAKLYHVETKVLNQTIKRNINRFPKEFCFQLDDEETKIFWSQIVTKKLIVETRGGSYKNPYVLTEQGIMMLSGLLRSDIAVKVNIQIIDAFVKLKRYVSLENKMLINHENRILKLEDAIDKMNEKEKVNSIFFDGQIYDAYSKIISILKLAKDNIIIIDSYADNTLLDIISKIDKKVTLICTNKLLKNIDLDKYYKQYNNLKIIYNNSFHDRYFILDNSILYHCGASINHLGCKIFSINKIEDNAIKNKIIVYVLNIVKCDNSSLKELENSV